MIFDIKDAVILQMGGQPEGAAALRRGAIDAAVLSLPHTPLAAERGVSRNIQPLRLQ